MSHYLRSTMETDFYPRRYKLRMTPSMRYTQYYVTEDVCVIVSTSFNGRGTFQKRTCGSQRRSCNMHKSSYNVATLPTCRVKPVVQGAVEEDAQGVHKVPGKWRTCWHTCAAGTPAEREAGTPAEREASEFYEVELGSMWWNTLCNRYTWGVLGVLYAWTC